jgi:predicted acyl esterase
VPASGGTPLSGPPIQYRVIPQAGRPRFSTLTSWESPDPSYFVPAGYAVVNLNLPGYGGSEGPPSVFSDHQSGAFFDAIEWVARQPWSTGAVGLCGVSFLAITQYYAAACRARGGRAPAALKAICPWEGFTDIARDVLMAGGVRELGFPAFWWFLEVKGALTGSARDFIANEGGTPLDWHAQHPLLDDFLRERLPLLERIETPMLVCASFSDHGLHTDGSLRAFARAPSPHKWLYTHRTGKWDAFYALEVQALIRQFFDCFVKGERDNGFLARPRVRLEVRSARDTIHAVRHEDAWPLPRTTWRRLYLDGGRGTLLEQPPAPHELAYDARLGRVTFDLRFDADTEVTGPMVLRVALEARPWPENGPVPTDALLFVAVEKRDRDGARVPFRGSVGNTMDAVTRGCIAASRRALDEEASSEWLPVLALTKDEPLRAGEIVPLAIALSASSTFFAAGEGLRLVIAGHVPVASPPYLKDVRPNRGRHVLHLGATDAAHLLVPLIPAG